MTTQLKPHFGLSTELFDDETSKAHNCALIVETKEKCFIIVWFIELRMWQECAQKQRQATFLEQQQKPEKRSESELWCKFDDQPECFVFMSMSFVVENKVQSN